MTHNLDQVLSQTKASLRLAFGGQQGSGDGVDAMANNIEVPSRWTLQKARVRLDVASMLLQRHISGQQGPISRYLAYDASPQGGVEIFCAAEGVVNMQDLQHAFPHRPSVTTRFLPLTTLGVGRMGQADKAQALIHQTWLECGPSAAAVRQANVCVRQCLTDMGVEANVVDLPDLVNQAVLLKLQRKRKIRQAYPQTVRFTEKEMRILQLIADDKTTEEIAESVFLSPRTVETIRQQMKLKAGVKTIAGLVMYATRNKLLE